jgi:hypothetical protein
MKSSFKTALYCCALALIAMPALAAVEQGDVMHTTVTSQVHLQKMQNQPAPQTHEGDICLSPQHDARELAKASSSRQHNCTYSNYKTSGGSESFHMSCGGDQPMQGDGNFKATAAGTHGTMHMTTQIQGQPATVDVTIDATRSGSCNYTPPPAF